MESDSESCAEPVTEQILIEISYKDENPYAKAALAQQIQPLVDQDDLDPTIPRYDFTCKRDEKSFEGTVYPTTLKEAQKESQEYVTRVYDAWEKLQAILGRRESTLRKRWMKKTKQQREKILRTAWPDIPARHRPDLDILLADAKPGTTPKISSEHADLLKWPHVNLDNLTQPRPLLLYLNSRGRNHPHLFAHEDRISAILGRASGAFKSADLFPYIMLLTGQETRSTYGKIIHLAYDPHYLALYMDGMQHEYGLGLLVLQIQARLYEFLLECCYLIFQDIPRESLADPQVQILPVPDLVSVSDTTYLKLSSAIAESPYSRNPSRIDTGRIMQLIAAKRASAEEQIWELREDPGCFHQVLDLQAQHRSERMRDIYGNLHIHNNDELFWSRTTAHVVSEAYVQFLRWQALYDSAKALHYGSWDFEKLSHLERLPESRHQALLALGKAGSDLMIDLAKELSHAVVTSSQLKGRYTRTPREDVIELSRVSEADDLMKLFEVLLDPESAVCGYVFELNIVDKIQRAFATDPSVKQRFSGYVYDIFSDYALVAYITWQVQSLWPWSSRLQGCCGGRSYYDVYRTFSDSSALLSDLTTVRFALNTMSWKEPSKTSEAEVTDQASPWNMQLLLKLERAAVRIAKNGCIPLPIEGGRPSNVSGADRHLAWERAIEASLRYPVERGYTKANIDAMRTAESTLDTMWRGLDEGFRKVSSDGLTLHETFLKYAEKREISRTPPFVPRPQRAPKSSLAVGNAALPSEAGCAHEPEVLPRRPVVEEPRTKIKTRKSSDPPATNPQTANQSTPTPSRVDTDAKTANTPSPLIFKAKDRSLKVLRTMFHTNASDQQQQGPIQFKDFLNAMIKVGFGVELLYGSVWHFTPGDSLGLSRSIQVHEPHPSSEISYRMARRLGRRLGRMYGWSGETFIEN
ncbi:hypothetical protein H2200_004745 [Cladophialophora chaetospira]|uniref:Uncharacterized protein n=1 Tax=Cladophialophora chaetospira TaxID=386627 RepID=A0AA38XDN8_9EURO|nr:hypothetical protein H2200_004745 [Cladophialophora chaetospira]